MNNDINEVVQDGVSYLDIKNLIKVFESSEYDSVEKAAAEIVDNAIDAEAKNITIYLKSSYNPVRGKETLSEIAFLDDGQGMSPGKLQHIVGFGASTRGNSNEIGKFGIGMNQASLFCCDRFEIYSWEYEGEVYKQVFDRNEIISNNITSASPSIKSELPSYILNSVLYRNHCKTHGTLVLWKNLKEGKFQLQNTVARHMNTEFGRIYRYQLNDGSIKLRIDTGEITNVRPIDPMCLLENDAYLGDIEGTSTPVDNGEPLFELFDHYLLENGSKYYNIPYYDDNKEIKFSKVKLTCASIKEKFYYQAARKDNIKQPGDTLIGKHLKELANGITIVRNNREIDFAFFGFYESTNLPNDRWFKLEVSFTQELDGIFNVSNNKQHVEIKKVNEKNAKDYNENDPNYPIWLRLNNDIKTLVAAMRKKNSDYAKGAKSSTIKINIDNISDNESSFEDVIKNFNNTITSKENNEKFSSNIINTVDSTNLFISNLNNDNTNTDDEDISINLEICDNIESIVNNISLNPNQQYYDANDIIVEYNTTCDKTSYSFDYNINKHIITFNDTNFKKDKFSFYVEYMLVVLLLNLNQCVKYSPEYYTLNKLLNNYVSYIWESES